MRNYKLFLGVLIFSISPMFGQGYYDDDIYYDAEKAKKEKQEKLAELQAEYEQANPEMKAPTYQVYNNDDIDVDAYNRMGPLYAKRDTSVVDSIQPANSSIFTYTDRIERFSNPDIVTASDDPELIELYYADDVNIYVGTPSTSVTFGFYDPWYSSWYSPWYGPRYASYWYSPFYTYWGYSYWDPWCSWYDPFWGPGYYYPYPYYGYHHHYPNYAWNTNHRYSNTGRRPFGGNSGSSTISGGRRPSNSTILRNSTNTGRRPSSTFNNNNNIYQNNQRNYNGYRGGAVNNNRSNDNDFDFHYSSPSNSYRRGTTTSPSYSNPTNRGNSGSFRGGSTGGGRGSFGGGRSGRR